MSRRPRQERLKKIKQEFAFPRQDEKETIDISAPSINLTEIEEKQDRAKASAEIPQIFMPDQVAFLFDVYTGLLSFVFSIILKSEFSVIHEELKFEPEQKAQMSVPLARIASKYAPVAWAGMQPEIELVITLGLFTVMSFSRASHVAKEHKKKLAEAKSENTSNVSEIRTLEKVTG